MCNDCKHNYNCEYKQALEQDMPEFNLDNLEHCGFKEIRSDSA